MCHSLLPQLTVRGKMCTGTSVGPLGYLRRWKKSRYTVAIQGNRAKGSWEVPKSTQQELKRKGGWEVRLSQAWPKYQGAAMSKDSHLS